MDKVLYGKVVDNPDCSYQVSCEIGALVCQCPVKENVQDIVTDRAFV